MASKKITKALIGGNWKSNGTVASIRQMADALNRAGHFSPNSEVVIAAPSIHLPQLKNMLRSDIHVSAEVSQLFIFTVGKFLFVSFLNRMSVLREVMVPLPVN